MCFVFVGGFVGPEWSRWGYRSGDPARGGVQNKVRVERAKKFGNSGIGEVYFSEFNYRVSGFNPRRIVWIDMNSNVTTTRRLIRIFKTRTFVVISWKNCPNSNWLFKRCILLKQRLEDNREIAALEILVTLE